MKIAHLTAALCAVGLSPFARRIPGPQRPSQPILARLSALFMALVITASIVQPAAAQQRVRSGSLQLAGYWATCGPVETDVMKISDIAASSGNRIILNPSLFAMPRAQQMFWYTHECGHQIFGPSEQTADCWSAEQGRIQGWLTPHEFELLATSIGRSGGDAAHATGPARVAYLRQCFYK